MFTESLYFLYLEYYCCRFIYETHEWDRVRDTIHDLYVTVLVAGVGYQIVFSAYKWFISGK